MSYRAGMLRRMGRRNRQRRAEKKRKHSAAGTRRRAGPQHGRGEHRPGRVNVAATLLEAGSARLARDDETALALVGALSGDASGLESRGAIAREVDTCLASLVAGAWTRGWQPADLPRLARHKLGETEARFVIDAIGADAHSYARDPAAPATNARWLAQLEEIGLAEQSSSSAPLLLQWAERSGVDWSDVLWCAAGALALLASLPTVPMLLTPPGRWTGDPISVAGATTGVDPRVLSRVRALLTKAESTQFEAEAEALSAKAQELMARHSVDRAVVDSHGGEGAEPLGRRIGVEAPYIDAKVLLLSEVASANRCRSVWSRGLCFCTVFGFEPDVEAAELLYTSLLVQAGTAMRAAGRVRDHTGRSRTRSFRQSFLVGFATRIGERLHEVTRSTTEQAEADHGASLLPVLAGRSANVDEACATAFPDQVAHAPKASSDLGFFAGKLAADQASVTLRPEVDERAASA